MSESAFRRWIAATPEQRQAWTEQAKQPAAKRKPLTLDALIKRMNWSYEYAEHLVQPYCECYDGTDGWEYCRYAYDEGVTP